MPGTGPTDDQIPLDSGDQGPDVTTTNEPAADKTSRIAEEDGGVGSTNYTVQPGMRLDRDGVILEAGTQVQFRSDEVVAGHVQALISAGIIA